MSKYFTERYRAYYYRLVTAVLPVLVAYGILAEETVPVWIGLFAALFGTSLATVNTSTKQ